MAPGTDQLPYQQLLVLKPFDVPAGPAAAAKGLGATGGATQYWFQGGIQQWIDAGYLEVVR
jgi:hypothetical protein